MVGLVGFAALALVLLPSNATLALASVMVTPADAPSSAKIFTEKRIANKTQNLKKEIIFLRQRPN